MKRIAVTGGAGQIAYSLLFRIASGELLGNDQPIALHILDIEPAKEALKGVVMELKDCAFPLLKEIVFGVDPHEVFKDIDYALLVGSRPRGPGMERGDLLEANGKIFVEQGKALSDVAKKEALVFVVGNPCNTNALIAAKNAANLDDSQFFAMMTLDEQRARSQLAEKAGVDVTEVTQTIIWGNHSAKQVPDFVNAKIGGKAALDVIADRTWHEEVFIPTVQKRGAAIIAARGKSSAASAASAAIMGLKAIIEPTQKGEHFSCAMMSKGNPYGIDDDLVFSFPVRSKGNGKLEIVAGIEWDAFLKERIAAVEKELKEEREMVSSML